MDFMKPQTYSHYNPSNARFLSEDPKGFAGKDTNLYRYARNNPIKYIDPLGKSAQLGDMGGGMTEYNLKLQFAACVSTSATAVGYVGAICSGACVASGVALPGCVGAVETLAGAVTSVGAAACVMNYIMKFNQSQQVYAPGTTVIESINVVKNDLIESGIGLTESGIDLILSMFGKK